jgi:hypothetical protein
VDAGVGAEDASGEAVGEEIQINAPMSPLKETEPKAEIGFVLVAEVGDVAVGRGKEGSPQAAEEVAGEGDDESGVVEAADGDLQLLVGDRGFGEEEPNVGGPISELVVGERDE